jgi:hypothetical protein
MPTELEEVRQTKVCCGIQRLTNSAAGGIPPPRKLPDQTNRYEIPSGIPARELTVYP